MRERNADERDVRENGGGVSARPILAEDRNGFVGRRGLWDEEQWAAAGQIRRVVDELGIEMVRFSFVDQHGVLRGKTISRGALAAAMRSGVTAPSSLLLKDTSGQTVFPVFSSDPEVGTAGFVGAGDIVLVPDPTTFRVLPWTERTGWLLCDLYFRDGSPVPFCTRRILRNELTGLAAKGFGMTVGAELEFHVFRSQDAELTVEHVGAPGRPGAAKPVAPTTRGAQLLLEDGLDRMQPLVDELYKGLTLLDLPLRSIELEFGPSQFEITMEAGPARLMADAIVLCRSAVRRIAAGLGYHATFMARPQGAEGASTGWHLHQSLTDVNTGRNVFVPEEPDAVLSPTASAYLAGLLDHAPAAAAFATPTVNGYKRYQPNSLAPDRVAWGIDNKGAMVRAVGGSGDPGTRLENRFGEPAANPYLYIASQIISGIDGIDRGLAAPPPTTDPYRTEAPALPSNLGAAIDALAADQVFRTALGDVVVDWYVRLKRAEFGRYLRHVSDWEQREYFDIF
ncbi:L-glutamine synthetase [Pseudonocardia thermophila]|jgi:Glutamine synthetase|uniref:L-glutamine synthetase n=1 Tax=Pseudonocardia thermophila TaxID=1848 RepID=A0A1M6WTI4_PSETH|nr:glutamine synthetase family protein [Pseudonocardia thermophila]SHK97018.1 L-glutamine synthetase [Pseudonocardia thermophila]